MTIWRHCFDLVCTAEELFQKVEDNKQTIESTTVLVGGVQLDGSDISLSVSEKRVSYQYDVRLTLL